MQHLNPYRFYELAAKLGGIFRMSEQGRAADLFAPLTETQNALDALIKGDPFPLETSKGDATRLLNKIGALFDKYFVDPATKQMRTQSGDERIDSHDVSMLHTLAEKFEHALAADLNRIPTYTASKRGIYSTYDLIENAHQCFAEGLQKTLPASALDEFDTAGRALAFGLGTAAAMHLLRATEIVLKQYYESFTGASPARNERNYSIYLKKLSAMAEDESVQNRPDRRLLQMLAQIKEHYRNPLASPESSVTPEQATSLFGLVGAIITLMAEQMEARQQKGKSPTDSAQNALASVAEDADVTEGEDSYDFRAPQARAS